MLKLAYKITELDLEQLLEVYRGSEPDEVNFLDYLREDFFRQEGAFYAIWFVDDMYKSAVRLEPYRDGLLLYSLETAPNSRREGYAYNLLSQLLQLLHNFDCKAVYSHVNKRNKPSLNLHDKCGFKVISDTATYIDGTVTQNSYTLKCNL